MNYFERVYLINLKFRPERLQSALGAVQGPEWLFPEPKVLEAVDGHSLPLPSWWRGSPGAWGCRQSHIRVLEDCISDDIQSVLVFEDDIRLVEGFRQQYEAFLHALPRDWDGIMLGGEHNIPPDPINNGVVRCLDTRLTLAYAVRSCLLRDLYQTWCSATDHIDYFFGQIQPRYRVYAPRQFLITPAGFSSDITDPPLAGRQPPWAK
jgi:hypothetical protein